jgi:hypothetical protein
VRLSGTSAGVGEPLNDVAVGSPINNKVSVSGATTSSFATNLATKKNSNLIVWQSWGDATANVARIGVSLMNVDDKACSVLPAAPYLAYKDITMKHK